MVVTIPVLLQQPCAGERGSGCGRLTTLHPPEVDLLENEAAGAHPLRVRASYVARLDDRIRQVGSVELEDRLWPEAPALCSLQVRSRKRTGGLVRKQTCFSVRKTPEGSDWSCAPGQPRSSGRRIPRHGKESRLKVGHGGSVRLTVRKKTAPASGRFRLRPRAGRLLLPVLAGCRWVVPIPGNPGLPAWRSCATAGSFAASGRAVRGNTSLLSHSSLKGKTATGSRAGPKAATVRKPTPPRSTWFASP